MRADPRPAGARASARACRAWTRGPAARHRARASPRRCAELERALAPGPRAGPARARSATLAAGGDPEIGGVARRGDGARRARRRDPGRGRPGARLRARGAPRHALRQGLRLGPLRDRRAADAGRARGPLHPHAADADRRASTRSCRRSTPSPKPTSRCCCIAEDVAGQALATLVVNKVRGRVQGRRRLRAGRSAPGAVPMLEDLAIATGGWWCRDELGNAARGSAAGDARPGQARAGHRARHDDHRGRRRSGAGRSALPGAAGRRSSARST